MQTSFNKYCASIRRFFVYLHRLNWNRKKKNRAFSSDANNTPKIQIPLYRYCCIMLNLIFIYGCETEKRNSQFGILWILWRNCCVDLYMAYKRIISSLIDSNTHEYCIISMEWMLDGWHTLRNVRNCFSWRGIGICMYACRREKVASLLNNIATNFPQKINKYYSMYF